MNTINSPFFSSSTPSIIVIGSGVIGLTVALELQSRGYSVTIITEKKSSSTTSAVAPAMWHPYKVTPTKTLVKWAEHTYQLYKNLSATRRFGIIPTKIVEYYKHSVDVPWYCSEHVPHRRIGATERPPEYGDGYEIDSFVIDTSLYLPALEETFLMQDGSIIVDCITNFEDISRPDTCVVNCTGLSSKTLCNDDDMYPIRGQVVRVASSYSQSNQQLVTSPCIIDEDGPRAISYVVPRTHDVIIGGTADENQWETLINSDTSKNILLKAQEIVPTLADAQFLDARVGLRPARRSGVRVEQDSSRMWLFHNYGHSGAGYTLSWGCAKTVAELIAQQYS